MSIRLGIGIDNFRNVIDADAQSIYNRIIADNGVSNLSRLNYLVKGLKTIYGSLSNTPVCYDAHWIGYQPANGVGATSGQACAKLYSLTVAGDTVQATASQQPLLLAHNGATTDNYYFTPQITGNSITSNTAITWTPASDTLVLTAKILAYNQTTVSWDNIAGQSTLFALQFQNNGTQKSFRINGSTAATAATLYTPSATDFHWIKATITPTNIVYSWSADNITYTALNTVSLPTFGTTGTLTIAGGSTSTANTMNIGSVILNNSTISSTITFDSANYLASTSQTTFTSGGATWTINTGTATTGYKGVLVDRTIVMGDGVDDFINNTTATRPNINTQYITYKSNSPQDFRSIAGANVGLYYNSFNPDAAFMNFYINGASSLLSITFSPLLNLYTAKVGSAQNSLSKNNGTAVTNIYTPTPMGTGISFWKNAQTAGVQNGAINTYILSGAEDDSTVQTAMYNFIKSLNNNAF